MQSSGWLQQFFEELKRRRVFRVATLYIVVFWPIIQIVDILSPAMDLPDAIMRYLVVTFVVCFPVTLILAWIFDINRGAIEVTPPASEPVLVPARTRRGELVFVGLLSLLVVGLFYVQYHIDESPSAAAEMVTPIDRSVGVLPFVAFSSDPTDQQFADGLTEELLNVLSRVPELRVPARTSSFAYRGVNRSVVEIGRELGVATILEGSVRRNDATNSVRVTAQLVETREGRHLWSKTWDRELRDVFKIQDDIASAVMSELQLTLLAGRVNNLKSGNAEAMVTFGLGQAELARRTELGLRDAIRFFRKTLEYDPTYADAWASLGNAYSLLASYGFTAAEDVLPDARDAVARALELAPSSSVAWGAQGLLLMQEFDKAGARLALEKAMELAPSNAMATMWYAGLMESDAEQLRFYQKAFELDPRSPVIGFNVANLLLNQGRDGEAMRVFARIVEADPTYHGAYHIAGRAYEKRGRLDEAIAQYERAFELSPSGEYAMSIATLFIDIGDADKAESWIKTAADLVPANSASELQWLRIQLLASTNRLDEAREILKALTVDADQPDLRIRRYLEGTLAAYLLQDFTSAVRAFEAMGGMNARKEVQHQGMFLEAALAATYSYQVLGRLSERDEMVTRLNQIFSSDKMAEASGAETWYHRAILASLADDRQMVLVYLQRAVDEGWRQYWRPFVEPALAPVLEDRAFLAMMAGLQARMEIMRRQLALAALDDKDWSG